MICKLNHLEEAFQKNFEDSNVNIFEIIYLVMVVHRSDQPWRMYYHHAFFHIPPKENMEELEEDLDNPCPAWIAHRATHLFFQLSGRNIYAKVFFLFFLKIIKNKKTSKSLIRYFSFLGIGIPSLVKLRTMSSGRRKGEGESLFFSSTTTLTICCQLLIQAVENLKEEARQSI